MIAIVDYKAGNIGSIKNALDRLGVDCVVTSDIKKIDAADGVIFPGQGRAGAAMEELKGRGIDTLIPQLKQPFLGICLGMQLLAEHLEEDDIFGVGIFEGTCRRFPSMVKTPQLGWNRVFFTQDNPLTASIDQGAYFYFLHSYFFDSTQSVAGRTHYGIDFPAMVNKDNFYAVQFHPEKSGAAGQQFLKNFCEVAQCI